MRGTLWKKVLKKRACLSLEGIGMKRASTIVTIAVISFTSLLYFIGSYSRGISSNSFVNSNKMPSHINTSSSLTYEAVSPAPAQTISDTQNNDTFNTTMSLQDLADISSNQEKLPLQVMHSCLNRFTEVACVQCCLLSILTQHVPCENLLDLDHSIWYMFVSRFVK